METAAQVVELDDRVDTKYVSITRQLITYMAQDPKNIPRVINILWTARAMERIGDRCGNIAEYLFYLVHGRDVRHPRSRQRVAEESSNPDDVQSPTQR